MIAMPPILAALLLAGTQTADPVRVKISWNGQTCGTVVDGASLSEDDLDRRGRQWAKEGREVSLHGTDQTPYRCIGAIIYRLQMAGLTRIGFISEPPARQVELFIPRGKCRVVLDREPETLATLRRRAAIWERTQPEIHFQVDPDASYQCVDRVLTILKRANVTRLGFIGNEAATPESVDPMP